MCDYGCYDPNCKKCAPLMPPDEPAPEGMHWCNHYGAAYFPRKLGEGVCWDCNQHRSNSAKEKR